MTPAAAANHAASSASDARASGHALAVCSDVAAHCNRLNRRARAVFALAPVATVLGGVAGGVGVRLGLQGAWLLVITGTVSGALLATLVWNGVLTNLLARRSLRTLRRASAEADARSAPRANVDQGWRWLRALVGDEDLAHALAPSGTTPLESAVSPRRPA